MAQLRAIKKHPVHATLGFVTAWPSRDGWAKLPNMRRFHAGVAQRARELGYALDEFWLTEPGMSSRRMTDILRARGIRGLVLASLPVPSGGLSLGWTHFACVTKGLTISSPAMHRVVSSHYEDMRLVLERLGGLGYRRVGLVLGEALNYRINGAWLAAYLLYKNEPGSFVRIPELILSGTRPLEHFRRWLRQSSPDVIIFSDQPVPAWVDQLGFTAPERIGLVNMDWSPEFSPLAGLDSEAEAQGMAATDLLVGQLDANQHGIPRHEKIVTIKGSWVPGKSVQRQPRRLNRSSSSIPRTAKVVPGGL
jgi:LacI family transcriptional regulator